VRERRMACPETWHVALFCVCGLCAVVRTSYASSGFSSSPDEAKPLLARVEIALIGEAEQDPALFERIRSLFPARTAVEQRNAPRIDQRAVLLPQRADTVYIWIRVTDGNARVYLARTEEGGQARYLFREIRLDAGVDEVGGETLAEIAHSSAEALWLHQSQTPRQAVVQALEREVEPKRVSAPAVVAPIGPVSAAPSPDSLNPGAVQRSKNQSSTIRLGLGASDAIHASGAEGWLHEPGAFLTFEYRARLSLRAFIRYLVPTDFDLPPARVRLSGPSGEFRAGFLSNDPKRIRVRLETGLGLLWGHAQASIVADQPSAHALPARDFDRVYALAAASFEWPLGPAWLAAGADLRVPLHATSYEVGGQSEPLQSAALCPGGSFEFGIGFDAVR